MTFAIPSWEIPSLPIAGITDRFPVRHIFCVGRNYADHAKEMGGDPTKEPPFFFAKAADSIVPNGGGIHYPPCTKDLHYEIELVAAIGKPGANIAPEKSLEHVYGYAVGLDMTRRDLQADAKEKRQPWDLGKSFAESAPMSSVYTASHRGHPAKGRITLEVNGQMRQQGDLSDMIWTVPDLISYLSRFYTLQPGDLIMTGTPAGVGAVEPGDKLIGEIEGLGKLMVNII
ncbi:MAG: fumarylacetoacetate hydrolase family protein [Burkholderiales bacterium]